MQIHVVKPGESLWLIAKRYGSTIKAIAKENHLPNPELIHPGQKLIINSTVKPVKEVNGYLLDLGPSGQSLIRDFGEQLTYITPFSYQVRPNGSIIPLNDEGVLNIAKQEQIAPLMAITNMDNRGFNSDIAHAILSNIAVQETLINNILTTIQTKGFIGLNIDFEYVFPADKDLYNNFLRRMTEHLRPRGFLISSALAPKISATQQGLLYEAHDYRAHGELLDFSVLMTYEWGWAGGPPTAVSPLNEVKRVLNYAITAIPPQKIMLGIPLYGYDWTLPYVAGESHAETLIPQEAARRAEFYGVPIQYNEELQAPFYYYFDEQGRQHEVWFEDTRSMQAKYQLVKDFNLRGVSYWVLNSFFAQIAPIQSDNFITKKI